MVEHVRQGDEQQGRTGIGLYAIGKACRNDNQTSHNGNEGVQNYHVDRFAGDTPSFFQIAAEDLHCTDAHAQGEERVRHGGKCHRTVAVFFQAGEAGDEEIFQTLACSFQPERVHHQYQHQHNEQHHHDFGDLFNAVLQSQSTDADTENNDDTGEQDHQCRTVQHAGEKAGRFFGGNGGDLSRTVQECVVEHPAGNHGIEHHQQIVSGNAGVFGDVPAAARLFQNVQCL